MQTNYTDGVSNIAFHEGVVRIEFVTTRQMDNEQREMIPAGSIAMSLPALLRIHEQLGKAIENMVDKGLLTKKKPEDAR